MVLLNINHNILTQLKYEEAQNIWIWALILIHVDLKQNSCEWPYMGFFFFPYAPQFS